MPQQIIKQPNGRYCIFSTIVDNITEYNLSSEEIKKDHMAYGFPTIEKVDSIISKLEKGKKPYYQFTLSYQQMIDLIRELHGENEAENVIKLTT